MKKSLLNKNPENERSIDIVLAKFNETSKIA